MTCKTNWVAGFSDTELVSEIYIDAKKLALKRMSGANDMLAELYSAWLEAELAEAKRRGLKV